MLFMTPLAYHSFNEVFHNTFEEIRLFTISTIAHLMFSFTSDMAANLLT